MSIPLKILEEKLAHARKHYGDVERNMRLRCSVLKQAQDKGHGPKPEDLDYMYRYKGEQWRCRLRLLPDGAQMNALMWWWHGPKAFKNEALDAILLRGPNMPVHFDTHFWSRWGLRSELMGTKLTNLMGFFKQYPDLPLRHMKRFYDGQPEMAAAIDQGLVVARSNGKRLISCDTFLSMEMLSTDERTLWERLRQSDAARKP